MVKNNYNVGIDIGSTTIKFVLSDNENNILFKEYRRHFADIENSIFSIIQLMKNEYSDIKASFCITGSAGMGISERCGIPFVQEVVASCDIITSKYPETRVLVDIGGEDSKMIFFKESNSSPDIRMNGSCAGGTGSFIDQIATLLNIEIQELNKLSENSKVLYPIASRCGVFCKTDIQNLLSQNVNKEDIAASVFHAVSLQMLTSLAKGQNVIPKVMLSGGPFYFIPELRKAFARIINLNDEDFIITENSAVFPAWGAALNAQKHNTIYSLTEFVELIENSKLKKNNYNFDRLSSLFSKDFTFNQWQETKKQYNFKRRNSQTPYPKECFIGIDSGSTTTKVVATDIDGNVFYQFYSKNNGNSLQTVLNSLNELHNAAMSEGVDLSVLNSCVTGYGEDLIKAALSINFGMVETIAHYSAANHFNKDVSFILDIGGQDMKAIFIEDGFIKRLDINEACSSGCGSFIETFAHSLNMTAAEFSDAASESENPCDLGTRCTVFMNSKVKQSLREGATVNDISAGLGYAVVKNCLNKVLKLRDYDELGENIMVQGGTFRNIAVIRSLELEIGKSVMITDYPELMGALGTALYCKKQYEDGIFEIQKLSSLVKSPKIEERIVTCKGCENSCQVKAHKFENNRIYYSGNKCEKIFHSKGERAKKGANVHTEKYSLLLDREIEVKKPKAKIGIPRALGIYENYPFWHTLFTKLNYEIVLSDTSTMKLFEEGINTIMSDNICFPAKIANGHILNLIDKKVDRIFLPFVVFEQQEEKHTPNSYNCPIVTGYSEVIRSVINPEKNNQIPFDSPGISFKDEKLLKKSCVLYFKSLDNKMPISEFNSAFKEAIQSQKSYERILKARCTEIVRKAEKENRLVILLAGRPYHIDPFIQHKISDIFADFGVDVISEDLLRNTEPLIDNAETIMQWAYTNRILKSAMYVAESSKNIQFVELTSFGCGPDAFILDEVNDILNRKGKNPTFLKIDDINNTSSTRLRIRSLIESLKYKNKLRSEVDKKFETTPLFTKNDVNREILIPWFGDIYSPVIPTIFGLLGYKMTNLPQSDQQSAELGLKYSNNEVCYPATLVIGDLIKALSSGKYNPDEVAVGITQTAGQCRATNYTALIKKALIAANFKNTPVVVVGLGSTTINEQPGFEVKWRKIFKPIIPLIVYLDLLSQMYYSSAPREIEKGVALKIRNKFIDLGNEALKNRDSEIYYELIRSASKEFTAINNMKDIPLVGIVGEIFVKYNNFGHKNVINWLVDKGVEPVIPAITNFFTDGFANVDARNDEYIEKRKLPKFINNIFENYVNKIVNKMEDQIKDYPFFRSIGNSRQESLLAKEVITLNAQFGEGWRIPAEIIHFAQSGINNVISLQPFGCIANHIVSKGIEKKIRELYPDLNLLSLDFDSGMSEVNIYNRLHLIIKNAKTNLPEEKLVVC